MGDIAELEHELKKGDVAAFIVELVQGKSVKFAKDDYYNQAQALCRKYGTLFICDEVQTGLGRTGKWFAFEHWGLEPDILTLAKALSGGYVPRGRHHHAPLDLPEDLFAHGPLHRPLDDLRPQQPRLRLCGLAALTVLEDEGLVDNAARMGAYLEKQPHRAAGESTTSLSDVRVKGLMCRDRVRRAARHHAEDGLEAGPLRSTRACSRSLIVTPLLTKHRILTQVAANNADIVKILPPLIVGEKEIDRFVKALDEVVADLGKFPGPVWEMGQNFVKALRTSDPRDKELATAS